MIDRKIENTIKEHINYFPVMALIGPRQSGKSTVVQKVLADYDYINLENVTNYKFAKEDPIGFIKACKNKTIIDEAQLVPELFNTIQLRVDKNQKQGQFVLTGSYNFLLQKNINQSLAGIISYLTLPPLSFKEIYNDKKSCNKILHTKQTSENGSQENTYNLINNVILRGGYPRLYNSNIPLDVFYRNYIQTYITRDVKEYLDIRHIETFKGFLRLLSNNVGSTINYATYARDLKVDSRTIQNWINILVSSFVIYLLPSYSTNVKKQIIKSPKLYFTDTGLVCYLNKIDSVSDLIKSPKFGDIYENFIIVDKLKDYYNSASDCSLYYYRDKSQIEIDLIDISNKTACATEIKSGMTYKTLFTKNLNRANDLLNIKKINKSLLYRGERSFKINDVKILSEEKWFLDNS